VRAKQEQTAENNRAIKWAEGFLYMRLRALYKTSERLFI
jgi:hypothetical protein